jgi:hypothetical protein
MGDFGMAGEPGQEDTSSARKHGRKGSDRLLIGAAVIAAILVIVGLWWWVHPTGSTQKKDLVQATGLLLAALVGLGGLYFTSQNLRQARDNTDRQLRQAREDTDKQLRQARENTDKQLEQARKSHEQTQRLTEQGQITERFTRAIEQLGATIDDGTERLEIRLGGIYALERIAKDSPEQDYSTVMEVLTAYVRKNAPLVTGDTSEPKGNADSNDSAKSAKQNSDPPRADIQAVLDVLGRRDESSVPEKGRVKLSLANTNLSRANFSDANFSNANLYGANLSRANLIGANFVGANLYGANLYGANLSGTNLYGAILIGANLYGAERWTKRQFAFVIGSENTKLPAGLERPPAWNMSFEEQLEILGKKLNHSE